MLNSVRGCRIAIFYHFLLFISWNTLIKRYPHLLFGYPVVRSYRKGRINAGLFPFNSLVVFFFLK